MHKLLSSSAAAALLCAACVGAGPIAPGSGGPTPAVRTTSSPRVATPSARPSLGATAAASTPTPAQPSESSPPSRPTDSPPPTNAQLAVEPFASGLPALTFLGHAGDGTGVLYAVGQEGVITALSATGDIQEEPFLDISGRITAGGEQGLLGLAFHPDYESNGRFFVNYTNVDGDTVIGEFARRDGEGPHLADADSERIVMTIDQPYGNHNGGMIAFGPDGYLYIAMGDGGSGGDPHDNGQNPQALLGKMLRIDVDGDEPYAIPASNPFLDDRGVAREIWAFGLRNPWRFSFDRETGDLFIGDVGQAAQEEINAEPAGQGGRNYGWNIMEGRRCFGGVSCDQAGLTLPVAVNGRVRGECAIIGGYVYRGEQFAELQGTYIYSDACTGDLWAFDARTAVTQGVVDTAAVGAAARGPSSFGEDETGELYVVDLSGEVSRLLRAAR